ncbi:MAG: hypothetical protein KQH53_02265 [Desulfarculaceae bacterium]|nr:hypothetical protein [Desulfarculaceae bacterium]
MVRTYLEFALTIVLGLGLGAFVTTGPAWAAGGGKQTCDKTVWDCVKKAQRVNCNRPWTQASAPPAYPGQGRMYENQSLCKGYMKWWVGPGTTLARSCPSKNQRVSDGKVDAAIKRARREMVHECFKFHVFLNPNASESAGVNRYPGRDQNGANCTAFADTFAQCLHDKYKRNPFK